MKVRNAAYNDLEILCDFQTKMALETENVHLERSTLSRGIAALLNDSLRGRYLIIENEDTVIGCCMITPEWSDWRCAWVLWLQSAYIIPSFRKKGAFAMLYNYVKSLVLSGNEYAGIRLYVDKSNHTAAKVYQRHKMNSDHYDLFEWMK